jgi:hypothetical protein
LGGALSEPAGIGRGAQRGREDTGPPLKGISGAGHWPATSNRAPGFVEETSRSGRSQRFAAQNAIHPL